MIRSNTNRKGEIAVQRTILRALELGLNVCRPCIEGTRYDLAVERTDGLLERVQVKYCDHQPGRGGTYSSRSRAIAAVARDGSTDTAEGKSMPSSATWPPMIAWSGYRLRSGRGERASHCARAPRATANGAEYTWPGTTAGEIPPVTIRRSSSSSSVG